MQKTVVKYVAGLSEDEKGSSWKVKQHKKYSGNLANVRKNISFDIKHGVTRRKLELRENQFPLDSDNDMSQYEWYSCLCRFSLLYPPSTMIPHLSHFILVSLVTSDYNSYPTEYEDKE